MLLDFSVQNWRSYKAPTSFSMIKTREQQHKERVPVVDKYHIGILPIAAIYGGNASGKTNLFRALSFVKDFVTEPQKPGSFIPVEPFLLGDTASEPSTFIIRILASDGNAYRLSFSVTSQRVIDERLAKTLATGGEKVLYERHGEESPPYFAPSFTKQETDNLQHAHHGTQDNQLFLSNSVNQKLDSFRPVYDWFDQNLQLIAPDSRFGPFEQFMDEDSPLYQKMARMLKMLDTGIDRLSANRVPLEKTPIPKSLQDRLQRDVKEGRSARMTSADDPGERLVVSRNKTGQLEAQELVALHLIRKGGDKVTFRMDQESDGSLRVIDLLPAFLDLSEANSGDVFVIDEIDRSLHTLLTRSLIEFYLSGCSPASRTQLIFTTHDALLMDQRFLRRDEIWVAERQEDGSSGLFSFSDYKDGRPDQDIRRSYLQGRLGGVPRIFLDDLIRIRSDPDTDKERNGQQ